MLFAALPILTGALLARAPELIVTATPLAGGLVHLEVSGAANAPGAIVFGEFEFPEQPNLESAVLFQLDGEGRAQVRLAAPPVGVTLPARALVFDGDGSSEIGAPVLLETLAVPPPGAVRISEVFYDPSFTEDRFGEWVEIHNGTSHTFDLDGWILGDREGRHRIDGGGSGVFLAPGGCLTLGRSSNPELNGDVQVDYAYGNDIRLHNRDDEVWVRTPANILVDHVAYGARSGTPDPVGRSIEWIVGAEGPVEWQVCHEPLGGRYDNPDRGSPGTVHGAHER